MTAKVHSGVVVAPARHGYVRVKAAATSALVTTLLDVSSVVLNGLNCTCLWTDRKTEPVKGSIPFIERVNLVQLSVTVSSPYAV